MAQATLIVPFSGGTYFDLNHYVNVNLPLALACWQRHGLESASAFFPRDTKAAEVSVGIYQFRDEDALHATLASRGTEAVMADVPRFTDATVSRIVGTLLWSCRVSPGQRQPRTTLADQLLFFKRRTR